jgi:hypothetical protein
MGGEFTPLENTVIRTPRVVICLLACLLLAGCDFLSSTPPPMPTVASMEMIQTAVVLTQNAPPPGFAEVAFPQIDANLAKHPAWHATIQLSLMVSWPTLPRRLRAASPATYTATN